MSLSSIRASTQDGTNGTPVATAVNEDSGSNALQAVVSVGNKTTYAEASRTGLTAADAPSGGDLSSSGFGTSLVNAANALSANLRATCTVSGATLVGKLVHYDASGNPTGYGPAVTFTSDGTLRLSSSGDYVSQRVVQDLGAARQVKFFVVSVTAGSWSVYVRPV